MLADPYPIQPWQSPCRGEVVLPGSKSLTNRALIIAALSNSSAHLKGALASRDTQIMVDLLGELGFDVQQDIENDSIEITGQGGHIPNATARLHVGNAGTVARFLTAFVCLHPQGNYYFDGDEEMKLRPMAGLVEALESLGASFSFHGREGCIPFEVKTKGLKGGRWLIDASASSQMLSALMMVAPLVGGPVRIECPNVRPAFVNMTVGIMRQWGAIIAGSPSEGFDLRAHQTYQVPGNGEFSIEPDVTAASYFMLLPGVVGGELHILGFKQNMLQGDQVFARVIQQLGMSIAQTKQGWLVRAGESLRSGHQHFNFKTFSDTFLTLAAVAPLLPAPVTIAGIGHTRYQETDRIHGMATELQRVGARVVERESSLTIYPFDPNLTLKDTPVTIETYRDHRVAMSFGILGCSSRFGASPWIRISDPHCCGKTFPGFFDELKRLYLFSHDK